MKNNKETACVDISYCDNYKKYASEGKQYCLICSRSIKENVKEASEADKGFFKHASEDI